MKIYLDKISIESDNRNVTININDNIKIPQLGYKYYYLNSNSLKSLKSETVHFGHSYKMNDVMDGNFLLWNFEEFLNDYMLERKLDMDFKFYYRQSLIQDLSNKFLKNIGYFCLCENFHNDLLWTHYTNERGFCIEYDIKELLGNFKSYQTYFVPINYSELQTIDFKRYATKIISNNKVTIEANIPLFYTLVNKEKFWNYEKEWRIIIRDENFDSVSHPLSYNDSQILMYENKNLQKRNLKINDTCIKKVILSAYFFDNSRFDLCQANSEIIVLRFVKNTETENLKNFIEILMTRYNNKIYQVDKYLENGKIVRNIKYKIEFLRITESYCEIKRNFC